MKRPNLRRTVSVVAATLSGLVLGLTGLVAAQSTISNTGPDSTNTVTNTRVDTCSISNLNNLTSNNTNDQTATTGDVNVSQNTSVGSGWGAWDPATWQAQGYSYQQWQAAFSGYLASIQSNWGNFSGGGAYSGNAMNMNSSSVNMHVMNGGGSCMPGLPGSGGESIDTTGPGSDNSIVNSVLGASAQNNNNNLLGANVNGQGASSGSVNSSQNTTGGGGRSGNASNGNMSGSSYHVGNVGQPGGGGGGGAPVAPSTHSSINNTGPNSNNNIVNSYSNTNTVTNNNTVTNTNTSSQTSTSGSSNSTQNTSAGGAGTGGANNSNTSNNSVHITN